MNFLGGAPEPLDLTQDRLVEGPEAVPDVLRVGTIRFGCRVDDVNEQDRNELAFLR